MIIASYTVLQTTIASFLMRTDLTAIVPTFIELAEVSFQRRPEFQEEFRGTITIVNPVTTLPAACAEVTSLYLDSTTARGPIDVVAPEQLALRKGQYGLTGIPQLAAVTSNGTELMVAPEPNTSFVANIIYTLKIVPLSATNLSNTLLAEQPDIYLYGALLESAPYLKDDSRIPVWSGRLEKAITEMGAMNERRRVSPNTLIQRPMQAIG